MMVVYAKLNGWAWAALNYTDWDQLKSELNGCVKTAYVLNVANNMTGPIHAHGEVPLLQNVKHMGVKLGPLFVK